jgi:hypothetical protein
MEIKINKIDPTAVAQNIITVQCEDLIYKRFTVEIDGVTYMLTENDCYMLTENDCYKIKK